MRLKQVKVLFVEDSEHDVELALRALKREGLEVLSCRVESEAPQKEAHLDIDPDQILSDI